MKVRNKLLNRIVAVGMLAVVLFCTFSLSEPEVAKAATYSYTWTESWRGDKGDTWTVSLNPVGGKGSQFFVTTNVEHTSTTFYIIVPENSFSVNLSQLKKGSTSVSNDTSDCTGYIIINDKKYYYYVRGYGYPNPENGKDYYTFNWSGASKVYSYSSTNSKYTDEDFVRLFITGKVPVDCEILDGVTSTDESTWKGGQDNPIEKANFGYPQIYNSTYIHNDPNNLETLDKLYSGQDFQWKKKTTTGFDLTNNDYNYTYIECKVKANYQYNDKFSGKGSWHDFASYGEMGNLGKVRAESLSHYYTFQEFQEALPKTSNELPDHKMRAIKSSAVYYFRVVCMKTSSTVVIPDEKDCKYYAGPWRSVTVTKINGKDGTSVVEDGEFDENGEWKKDDDSGDNGKDIDNGSAEGDDLSDASDKAHETINSNANKPTLDLDSAKAFINQVADVPKMIADIFSFLPDWVKYSFAFGFALIPILIIFKLIRG